MLANQKVLSRRATDQDDLGAATARALSAGCAPNDGSVRAGDNQRWLQDVAQFLARLRAERRFRTRPAVVGKIVQAAQISGLINRRSAISVLVRPAAMSRRISTSRAVSDEGSGKPAGGAVGWPPT